MKNSEEGGSRTTGSWRTKENHKEEPALVARLQVMNRGRYLMNIM
jgi:hypothetical protein